MLQSKFTRAVFAVSLITLSVAPTLASSRPIAMPASFRPIGGHGTNLRHRAFEADPGEPERSLAPLHFAPDTFDGPMAGPNPRLP